MNEKVNQITQTRARHIMHSHKPRGWKIKMGQAGQQRGASGLCEYGERTIYIPYVCDDYSLMVYLHEVGHVRLHRACDSKPSHVQEYEAERWSHAAMRSCGFKVTREILRSAKNYVREEILKDEIKGLPITAKIRRWVGPGNRQKSNRR